MKENWEIKKLDEVCDTINGLWTGKKEPFIKVGVIRNTNFTKDCKLDDADIAYLDVEVKQFNQRKLKYGDIILEKSGGSTNQPVGRVVLFEKKDGDFSFSNFTSVIRIKDKSVLSFKFLHKYLSFLYFTGYTERLQSNTTGIRNLDFNRYKKTEIPIPPLPVQETIVKELDILHRLKELQEQQLAEYDNLAQSTFYSMFGDPIENEKGWEVRKLGEVCDTTSGGTPSSKRTEYYDNGTINWLRSGEVNKIFITESELKITEEGLNNSSAKMLPINTVLIAMYGATVGQVGILKFEASTNQAICGILPNDYLNPVFLYFTLFFHKPYYLELAMGGAQPNISQTIIKNTNVIFPPLSFQTDFANRIEKIDAQKELVKQGIAETQLLIDYTMDKYFG